MGGPKVLQRLAIPFCSLVLYGILLLSGLLTVLSNNTMDLLFHLRGSLQTAQSIVIIGVDEESLDSLGPWPFARHHHAELLRRLNLARAVGLDFLMAEPTVDDPELAEAVRSGPPVILAVAHTRDQQLIKPAPPLDVFTQGHIETILSGDGVVRRVRLRPATGPPPFAVAMLQAANLKAKIPNDNRPRLINYFGPEQTFLFLSYSDVINGRYRTEFFKDRLVLVGAQAYGLGDVHVTPFSTNIPTPGIEIQATIINNLLDNSFIRQLTVLNWFFFLIISLMAVYLWPTASEKTNLSIIGLLVVSGCIGTVLFFRQAVFIDLTSILAFLGATYLLHLLYQLFLTANRILGEIAYLDSQLRKGLDQVYTNIPKAIIQSPAKKSPLLGSGAQQWLDRLQTGIKALSVQHHFLEDLLTKELPPLILWEMRSGKVIFTNTMFDRFWTVCSTDSGAPPDFQVFATTLQGISLEKKSKKYLNIKDLKRSSHALSFDIQTPPGQNQRYYRVILHPLNEGETGFKGAMAILTDVTEIRELERVKDEIVSVVSHELKLPLTTILGYGEMLSDILQADEKQYAEEICLQTKRLNQLIEDFLDIARLESGSNTLRALPFDFIRLIEEAVASIKRSAEIKSIDIHTKVPQKVSPCIGDSQLLRQALTNLLDNAIKFSPAQSTVGITLVEETDIFSLEVADQGPGIAGEEHLTIFDKFNRGSGHHDKNGFGLGLNFVKQVIERHNGSISLVPPGESGAVFRIKIPKRRHE